MNTKHIGIGLLTLCFFITPALAENKQSPQKPGPEMFFKMLPMLMNPDQSEEGMAEFESMMGDPVNAAKMMQTIFQIPDDKMPKEMYEKDVNNTWKEDPKKPEKKMGNEQLLQAEKHLDHEISALDEEEKKLIRKLEFLKERKRNIKHLFSNLEELIDSWDELSESEKWEKWDNFRMKKQSVLVEKYKEEKKTEPKKEEYNEIQKEEVREKIQTEEVPTDIQADSVFDEGVPSIQERMKKRSQQLRARMEKIEHTGYGKLSQQMKRQTLQSGRNSGSYFKRVMNFESPYSKRSNTKATTPTNIEDIE